MVCCAQLHGHWSRLPAFASGSTTVLGKVLQRNRTNGCVLYIERKIHRKELAHVIMETDKLQDLWGESESRSPRKSQKAGRLKWGPVSLEDGVHELVDPTSTPLDLKVGESQCPSSKASRQEEFSLTWERVSLFVLFRPSTDWMRPTHIREGNLLHSFH